ncbi:MAG: trypsin-like peptidase domain-containing protein [Undibacterium sp.]|nr:trypsin-like peptidase domain-containing protein [Opitutaceae bacterium]
MRLSLRLSRVSTALALTIVLAAPSIHAADPKPAAAAPVPVAAGDVVENSVVKIFSTMRYPDLTKPWTKQAPRESTGSGVVIEGKRILTNAHLALYASQVQVQANQSGDKLSATVEFVAPGIDLAVLKLDDETFFDTHRPLARDPSIPAIKDAVLVYGFPTGGTSLSITKGIVSRVEFTSYNFRTSGLRIQIDAAINPGNSGGPALGGEKMIGLAFSRLGSADNIGYIIPNEEIDLFLADIGDGRYDGKPALFDSLQTFENPALRPYLKLDKNAEGMIVNGLDSPDATYPLQPWDVITKIGDTPIDNEGYVKIGANLRLRFPYLIQHVAKAGHLPLTVMRTGQPVSLDVPVSQRRPLLIPNLIGEYPAYFICGPVAFATATQDFIGGINNVGILNGLSADGSPLVTRRSVRPAFEGEELVIITAPFFPHKLAKGYSPAVGRVVKTVNGTPVKNLRHLVELLRDARSEHIVIDFQGRGYETLVFPRKELIASTDEILTDNGVRSQASSALLAVWNEKPQP